MSAKQLSIKALCMSEYWTASSLSLLRDREMVNQDGKGGGNETSSSPESIVALPKNDNIP